VSPELQAEALKDYERGQTPITSRPADVLEPELEAAKAEVGELAADIGDVLTYVLYPTTGMRFLRWKYGLETPPANTRAKTLEDINREDEMVARVRAGATLPTDENEAKIEETPAKSAPAVPVEGTPLLSPMPGTVIRYLVEVGDEVEAGDGVVVLEAMKMENVLPAPEDGKVVAIRCEAGDKVQLDQILAVIG
jgi:biotin carboxyl carrier protein